MITPISNIKQALYSPAEHFNRLRGIEPLCCHRGIPNIWRTHLFAECDIRWKGACYRLYIPLSKEYRQHLKQLKEELSSINSVHLAELHILENDLCYTDANGRTHYRDAIIQRVDRFFTLEEALEHYSSDSLCKRLLELQKEMERIGFTHHNLKPSNILLREDGTMYLIRYWYAELGEGCHDDYTALYDLVMRRGEKPAKQG